MASLRPGYGEAQGGDEPTRSPNTAQNSLLGAERGTQHAKRLETDANNNLYTRIAANDTVISALANGAVTSVADNILTTIVTYTPGTNVKITKISVSGTNYAKIQLFINSSLVETLRMGPSRNIVFNWIDPLGLSASTPLDIKVTHYITTETNDFEATVYGV